MEFRRKSIVGSILIKGPPPYNFTIKNQVRSLTSTLNYDYYYIFIFTINLDSFCIFIKLNFIYIIHVFNQFFGIIRKLDLKILISYDQHFHRLSTEVICVLIRPFNIKHYIFFRFHVNKFSNYFLFNKTST